MAINVVKMILLFRSLVNVNKIMVRLLFILLQTLIYRLRLMKIVFLFLLCMSIVSEFELLLYGMNGVLEE